MKRRNEFAVGATVLFAVAIVVAGALWLSGRRLGGADTVHVARFKTMGGAGVGAPVTLRGVKVGRVEAIRLTSNDWVEADLRITEPVELPVRAAAIAASASLFGEWRIAIVPFESAAADPTVMADLAAAASAGGDAWPGATLPDIGQLTAEASRIASDVGLITNRIEGAVDSTAIADLRRSIGDFRVIADKLAEFTGAQISTLNTITGNVSQSTGQMTEVTRRMNATLVRIDSATAGGQLNDLMNSARSTGRNVDAASGDLRELTASIRANQQSIVRVLTALDTVMTRLQHGQGTLSLLTTDSTLYRESTETVIALRKLLADIQANPRRYFRFSVF